MAKKAKDKLSTPAEEELKRQKQQARQEVILMLEIEEAKKQLKNAQKKQSKAQALVETRSTCVQSLETRLTELRTPTPEPEIEMPPQSEEIEQQLVTPAQKDQVDIASLTDEIFASPQEKNGTNIASSSSETEISSSMHEEQKPSFIEEPTPQENIVANNEVTEKENAQENGNSTETETVPTTPGTAPARKKTTTRKPTATRRPANNTRSSKQTPSDSE